MTARRAQRKIALLINPKRSCQRDILSGVAAYMRQSRLGWQLALDEDGRGHPGNVAQWDCDGVIADFDDPAVVAALHSSRARMVAVGGSYRDAADYPAGVPYVAADNAGLVRLAYEHLVEAGLHHFAFYGLPATPMHRWAQQREQAFTALAARDKFKAQVYPGQDGGIEHWDTELKQLARWLRQLPQPVGVIAVNDARAQQLVQACALAGLRVPEQVAVVGIGNDALAGMLAGLPLSSVIQNGEEIGRTAAQIMHRMLQGAQLGGTRIVVAPAGVHPGASCQPLGGQHPQVVRALYYIRQFACHGIKSEQVVDYVGTSRSGLEAHFRRELGRSVHEEILRQKLDAATKMLALGSCNIADTAVRCGFTSVQYLYTVFARELGCTPRAYHLRHAQIIQT